MTISIRPSALVFAWLAMLSGGLVPSAIAQTTPATRSVYERYTEPIQFYTTGLGDFKKPISTKNADAQAYFSQGFQMMYAFAKAEAVRSFREAWKRDGDCAICYWGEAWAWGSYLNAPMTPEESPHAYAAVQKALGLRNRADAKEKALIDAMAVRYVETFDASTRVAQDRAYAEAMRTVAGQYPNDLEIATLYADALFLLEPRRGTRDINDPNVKRLHQALESVLSRDLQHPGACHLYVHATESTVDPGRAQACAEFLGKSIPGASHINHMPSHTWNEVGRWGDSVRANLEAWHSDLKASVGEGFAIYPEHNLHMLLYAASYDGQGAIAMRAGKDYGKLNGQSFYEVLTLMRFGRFDEILEVKNRPQQEIQGGAVGLRAGLCLSQAGPGRLRQGLSRTGAHHCRDVDGGLQGDVGEGAARRRCRAFSTVRSSGWRAICQARSPPSRPRRMSRRRSPTTNRNRCRSRRAIGWVPPCSRPDSMAKRRRSIAPISKSIRTTAGRCSACSRRSRGRARRTKRWTMTSPQAGRDRTPGSARRGSEENFAGVSPRVSRTVPVSPCDAHRDMGQVTCA